MMIVSLEDMKKYLRLEPSDSEEDDLILGLLLTAEDYIKRATGFKFEKDVPETAKLIVRLLTSHWYENRTVEITQQGGKKISFAVDVLLMQLTYTHSEEEGGTQ